MSHETIYQTLYMQAKGELRAQLKPVLVQPRHPTASTPTLTPMPDRHDLTLAHHATTELDQITQKEAHMPPSSIHVQLGTSETIQAHEESIFRLYYDAFSQSPYEWPEHAETEFRQRLSRLARDATLGIITAQAENELIGFAYGHTLRPDTKWWDGFITPVPEDVTTEHEGRTFALIDFAVAEAWRGHGIGRRLHDTLLDSRPEARATLAVEPVAHDARAIYEGWGWRVVGRLRGPATDFAPEFDIMVRDLPLHQH